MSSRIAASAMARTYPEATAGQPVRDRAHGTARRTGERADGGRGGSTCGWPTSAGPRVGSARGSTTSPGPRPPTGARPGAPTTTSGSRDRGWSGPTPPGPGRPADRGPGPGRRPSRCPRCAAPVALASTRHHPGDAWPRAASWPGQRPPARRGTTTSRCRGALRATRRLGAAGVDGAGITDETVAGCSAVLRRVVLEQEASSTRAGSSTSFRGCCHPSRPTGCRVARRFPAARPPGCRRGRSGCGRATAGCAVGVQHRSGRVSPPDALVVAPTMDVPRACRGSRRPAAERGLTTMLDLRHRVTGHRATARARGRRWRRSLRRRPPDDIRDRGLYRSCRGAARRLACTTVRRSAGMPSGCTYVADRRRDRRRLGLAGRHASSRTVRACRRLTLRRLDCARARWRARRRQWS